MQILHSDEFISKLWDEYVTAYNEKRMSVSDMLAISDRQAGQIQRIEKSLDSNYGFTMDAWELIKHAGYKQNVKAFQLWIERNGFTRQQFNDAFAVICQESQRFFEMHMERGIIEIITQIIRENSFPSRIDMWDELTEAEKDSIAETRGRKVIDPDMKKRVTEYFKKHEERLEKSNLDDDGYPIAKHVAVQVIKELDEELGISRKYKDPVRTITGWIYKH